MLHSSNMFAAFFCLLNYICLNFWWLVRQNKHSGGFLLRSPSHTEETVFYGWQHAMWMCAHQEPCPHVVDLCHREKMRLLHTICFTCCVSAQGTLRYICNSLGNHQSHEKPLVLCANTVLYHLQLQSQQKSSARVICHLSGVIRLLRLRATSQLIMQNIRALLRIY